MGRAILLGAIGGALIGAWISVGVQYFICDGFDSMCSLGLVLLIPIIGAVGLITGGVIAAKMPARRRTAWPALLITDVVLFVCLAILLVSIFGSPF